MRAEPAARGRHHLRAHGRRALRVYRIRHRRICQADRGLVVRRDHGHGGTAPAGAGAGDRVGRVPWRNGRSRPPQRSWRAVHWYGVHHQSDGIRHAAVDRYGRRLVRQRHGRIRRRRVQDQARLAAQALPGSGRAGAGDVPVGLVVELETAAPVIGLQDTGSGGNRVLYESSGASRLTIRAEQKSGHFRQPAPVSSGARPRSEQTVHPLLLSRSTR